MERTKLLQEIRMHRFEETYEKWGIRSLTQEEAAQILGVSSRRFRRYVERYEEEGLEGLRDRRIEGASSRRAPVDEVMALQEKYNRRHQGWTAKHFYAWYKREGGVRSYTWVKERLQEGGLVKKSVGRGKHRKRREGAAWPGMMLHQDASKHQWVGGKYWDLVVTMDDATSEHYSMFFVNEKGTGSSFRGVKVDRVNLTQIGRAMKKLGIEMIAAYSPEARGRPEGMFSTHRGRLPKELALAGITEMADANCYLREKYMPLFNEEFQQPAMEAGSAFVKYPGEDLEDILCEEYERVVGKDNCVSFEGLILQIPEDKYRMHYVKVSVRVHRYPDGSLSIFHGPRKLAAYEADGGLAVPRAASSVKAVMGRSVWKRRRATPATSSTPTAP